jgi:selenium metabolism protein YedF
MRIVDTKGLVCPVPLIETKKVLKETTVGDSFIVLTDNQTSFDNLRRFLNDNHAQFQVSETGGVWTLTITKTSGEVYQTKPDDYCTPSISHFEKGDFIIAITSDKMGDGDDELGHLLMGNFIKAIKELNRLPVKMVFYNKGVTIVTNDSPLIGHLKDLETMGVELLLCATCVNHYSIEDRIGAGILSNMYAIAEAMASTGNIIKP